MARLTNLRKDEDEPATCVSRSCSMLNVGLELSELEPDDRMAGSGVADAKD